MQRALPSQTWIRRLGSTQREGRGRVECTALGTAWILIQCCPHMRVRSLLRHTRVHLLRPPVSGVEEIRDLIREELRAQLQTQQAELQTQFGDMVQQLISAMQGVRPSQPAPQVSITINFIYFE